MYVWACISVFLVLIAVTFCFQAVMNRIHTISVPYAVMKACPLSWVQRVHIHKGDVHVSVVWRNPERLFNVFLFLR